MTDDLKLRLREAQLYDASGEESSLGEDALECIEQLERQAARLREVVCAMGGGCDANDGGAHSVVRLSNRAPFCGGCGETLKRVCASANPPATTTRRHHHSAPVPTRWRQSVHSTDSHAPDLPHPKSPPEFTTAFTTAAGRIGCDWMRRTAPQHEAKAEASLWRRPDFCNALGLSKASWNGLMAERVGFERPSINTAFWRYLPHYLPHSTSRVPLPPFQAGKYFQKSRILRLHNTHNVRI